MTVTITGPIIEVGNIDGGADPGVTIEREFGRFVTVLGLTEDEARAMAPGYGSPASIVIINQGDRAGEPQAENDIPRWWQEIRCTRDPGASTGEESARDSEIAELRTALKAWERRWTESLAAPVAQQSEAGAPTAPAAQSLIADLAKFSGAGGMRAVNELVRRAQEVLVAPTSGRESAAPGAEQETVTIKMTNTTTGATTDWNVPKADVDAAMQKGASNG